MSAPSEPEKYSIDEMMERLKTRTTEDPLDQGELVIRADGSQAIRVRKRKRRSHQPHKEELRHHRRARILQVSAALILLLLAVFGAGAAIIFANSPPFREALIQKIAVCSGAKVDLQQFRMNPTSANAGQLVMTWPEGNALRDLTLGGVKARIFPSSFLGKSMAGEEVSSAQGTLTLRLPRLDKPSRETTATDEILPIRFNRYAVPQLNVVIGDPAAPLVRMQNSEGSFQPVNPNGRAQLLLNRGDLAIQGWPKLQMDRSHIEFRGPEVDVISMRLKHENDSRGVFELSGTVLPYLPDRASTFAVELDSYLVAGIAGPELGRLFSGRIDTLPSAKSNVLTFRPGSEPEASLAIAFRKSLTSPFELNGFPFLFGLYQTLDDDWFQRPMFESDVSGVIRRAEGKVALSELNFENKDRMALRGALTLTPDGKLSGNLEVGVAEAMIKSSPNRRLDVMFGPLKEGFRWLTLKIGGTGASPTDNFRELFEAAKTTVPAAPAADIPSFEDLTQPE